VTPVAGARGDSTRAAPDPRRIHDRVLRARLGGAASFALDPARLPRRPPARNKGMRYPAEPATVEEIVAVTRHAPDNRHGWRVQAIIVLLWRAGLRKA
jgi:hypothetical protein